MPHKITQVDAFTNKPFAGNPAAVCILPSAADDAWMQQVAAEMNLSETAFLHTDGPAFRLRWFTPEIEVPLCGHATLASAHVLWEEGHCAPDDEIRFLTKSGELTACQQGEWIELNFPSDPITEVLPPVDLAAALGAKPLYVGKGKDNYLVELASDSELRRLKPDFAAIAKLGCGGLIVTSLSESSEFDFVSRFFAPTFGIDEDPVTGSAHCCLAPYWTNRLGLDELTGYQASARGGIVRTKMDGDRVRLAGQAVTVMRAELL